MNKKRKGGRGEGGEEMRKGERGEGEEEMRKRRKLIGIGEEDEIRNKGSVSKKEMGRNQVYC